MWFKKLRWKTAALVAFVMGIPMAERAMADDGGDVFSSALDLALSIASIAGDS